jgi:RNA polymerase sporulation-specific sigma factor
LYFALHFDCRSVFPKPLSAAEEKECFEKMAQGDRSAREKLISHNLRLVAHIIKKYYNASSEQDDLISIGTIGLIKGVSTFDYKKGTRFATYASRCVENEILMHFRSTKKLSAEVHFDEPVDVDKNGNALTLMDIIADDDMPVADKCSLNSDLRRLCGLVNTLLDDREREIIVMRYGLGGLKAVTQREAAQRLGISRSYVSRIEKKAMEKLRSAMENGR